MNSQNTLKDLISQWEDKTRMPFKGNKNFYDYIGIGQRRFGQLLRGERNMTYGEKARLANYFDVEPETICQSV